MVREGMIQYDKDMPALRVQFMTDRSVANGMEVIRKATSKPGLKLLRHLTIVPADNLKDAERHCALVSLPSACKENLLQWCVINEEPTTEGTMLRLVPHDTSIFVGECQMEVWTYGQVLCRTSPGHGLTLSDGIDAMIVANMLFDTKEELKCVGTWRFAQEIIYK
ncbi:uncharacterized protein LOC117645794 isoform X2 [Thrips palmi]|uniref:Uncharacterized protein LOC117645794 isoform X2 n=1 Tax=Thrips palmi TaxID=161013 RepID=A0A6P8YX08_THRPL|nr:uncharacterized protein LOC117645794 isoform X2 [Thrips palmi]